MNLPQQLEQARQLSELWAAMIDGHLPTQRQFLIWLTIYDPAIVEKGIQRCAIWANKPKDRVLADDEYVRYASGVMANAKREAQGVARG